MCPSTQQASGRQAAGRFQCTAAVRGISVGRQAGTGNQEEQHPAGEQATCRQRQVVTVQAAGSGAAGGQVPQVG